MSRRRTHHADSLELLLDTICNTFGGVLFIAILVVLLLQQTGTAPSASMSTLKSLSPLEIEEISARLEAVSADLDRARLNRDSQDAIVQTFASDEIRQLLATRTAVTQQQESLESENDQQLASNAELVAQAERLAEENQTVRTEWKETKERFKTLQTILDDERHSRVQEIRLPVIREELGKTEIGLVMRYGRLYVWHEYGPDNVRGGLNTKDFVVVGELGGGLVTRPNPTRGIVLDESESCRQATLDLLRRFDPKTCYLAIIVRPDSHAGFRYVRDPAIELGFEYRLMPAGENEPVSDRGGSGGKVQ